MSTDTTPRPPRDYGGGVDWTEDGDYYVPVDLREHYADAEPSDVDRAAYIRNGTSISQMGTRDVPRLVASGTADMPPVVTTEQEQVRELVDYAGGSGYPVWLHHKRLELARVRKHHADRQAAHEAGWLVCQVCGAKSISVHNVRVPVVTYGERVPVTTCPDDLPLLEDTARAALATLAADRLLPDGRRAGDVARDIIGVAVRAGVQS